MNLPKSLTTVTSFSKILAGVLFITLPFVGFYLGMEYEKAVTPDFKEVPTPVVRTTPKPTTDPTANWKTYTNREYGFEFKYPNIWSSTSAGPNEAMKQALNGKEISGTVQPSLDTIIFSDEKGNNFDIGIFEYKKELSPKEYEEGYLYTLGPCDLRFGFTADKVEMTNKFSVQFLKVNGKLTFLYDKSSVSYLTCYYTKNNEDKLLVLSTVSDSLNKDSTLMDKILSTFKFLDQIPTRYLNTNQPTLSPTSQTAVTGNSIKDLGISFKYPKNLQITSSKYFFNDVFQIEIGPSISILLSKVSFKSEYMINESGKINTYKIDGSIYDSTSYVSAEGGPGYTSYSKIEEIKINDSLYIAISSNGSSEVDVKGNTIAKRGPTEEELLKARQIIESTILNDN